MKQMEVVHRRLIAGSKPLTEFIKELGYEFKRENGHGLRKSRLYFLNGKYLEVGHHFIKLFYYVSEEEVVAHKGLSVHDQLLIFFTKRDYKHDKTDLSSMYSMSG